MIRTATCRCRGCAIEVEGEPVLNPICHCADCKRRTGGPCGWFAVFRAEQVLSRRGDFTIYLSEGTAGRAENAFCSACGTTLFSIPTDFPGIIGCAGGCFEDDPLGEPTLSTSDDRRCAWLRLPDSWAVRTSEMVAARRPRR
jgi:hypothetical protein